MPKRHSGGRDSLGQLLIPWGSTAPEPLPLAPASPPVDEKQPPALLQNLKWDFQQRFPQPTEDAIETGIISDEDLTPDNIKAIHDEHAREMFAALHDLDAIMDPRRRGLDPATGHAPRSPAAQLDAYVRGLEREGERPDPPPDSESEAADIAFP